MNLQTRKLNLISYLAQLQDESLLNEIGEYISKLKGEDLTKPFSVSELNERIKKSEEDFKNRRFKSHTDLEDQSKNW